MTNRGLWRVAPSGLAAWSPDGDRFAFLTTTLKVSLATPSRGVVRLEVSSSPTGAHRLWYETAVSFSKRSGLHGDFVAQVDVLPDRAGALIWIDPDRAGAADGLDLYLLRAPGDVPTQLGTAPAGSVNDGRPGTFAIVSGGNRYAWLTKTVETCVAATAV